MYEDQLKVNEFKAYKLPTDLVINITVPEGSSDSDPTEELGCIDNISILNTEKGVELNILFSKQSEDKKTGSVSVTDQTTVTNILLSELGDSVLQQETRLKVQQSGKHTLNSTFQLTNDKQPVSTSRILLPNSPKAGAYVSEDFSKEIPRSFCRYPCIYGNPFPAILGLEGVDYLMGLHDIRYLGNAFTSASDIPAARALLFECLNNNSNTPVKLLDQQHRILTVFSVHSTLPLTLKGKLTKYALLWDTTTTNTAWYLIEHSSRELTEEDTSKYSEMVEAYEEERQRHLKVIEYYKEEQRRKKEELENSLLANK